MWRLSLASNRLPLNLILYQFLYCPQSARSKERWTSTARNFTCYTDVRIGEIASSKTARRHWLLSGRTITHRLSGIVRVQDFAWLARCRYSARSREGLSWISVHDGGRAATAMVTGIGSTRTRVAFVFYQMGHIHLSSSGLQPT